MRVNALFTLDHNFLTQHFALDALTFSGVFTKCTGEVAVLDKLRKSLQHAETHSDRMGPLVLNRRSCIEIHSPCLPPESVYCTMRAKTMKHNNNY